MINGHTAYVYHFEIIYNKRLFDSSGDHFQYVYI